MIDMRTRPVAAVVAAGCVILPGCIAVENARLEVGEDLRLPALVAAESTPPPPASDGPTLTGLDRGNWGTTTFRVPRDSVESGPPYRPLKVYPADTARQRGEFPTALTALDGSGGNNARQVRGIVGSAGRAVVDAVCILPAMIVTRAPCYTVENPRTPFERWPQGSTAPYPPAPAEPAPAEPAPAEPAPTEEP